MTASPADAPYFLPFLFGSPHGDTVRASWIGIGIYADPEEAVDRTVHVTRRQAPRPKQVEYRSQRYQRYLAAVQEEASR